MTHSVTYLPSVDHIVVIKDGRITEQGSYQELLTNKGEFQDFLLQYLAEAVVVEDDILPGEDDVPSEGDMQPGENDTAVRAG